MKKRTGLKRAVDLVATTEISNLSTGALLARLQQLRSCMENPEDANDFTPEELETVKDKIMFKSDHKWKSAYRDVRSELDTREHKGNMSN